MARVLIADDDQAVRNVLATILRMAGHEVVEIINGEEALRLCCEDHPDLVITDLIMPGVSGFEVIRQLRAGCPDAKIVAIAGADRELLAKAEVLGAARTLEKPFQVQEVLEVVKELLQEVA